MIRGELLDFVPNASRAIQAIYEDLPGGAVLYKAELRDGPSGIMAEGVLLSLVSGIAHLTKTAMVWSSFKDSATGINIYKENELKVNDFISDSLFTMTSRRIIDIDRSNVSYDFVNIGSGFNVSGCAGTILVETSASGTSGINSALKYVPDGIGISELPLDLSRMNAGMGVMVRGSVRTAQMPFPVDGELKKYLPLIRFV